MNCSECAYRNPKLKYCWYWKKYTEDDDTCSGFYYRLTLKGLIKSKLAVIKFLSKHH